jgi:hypothetical protein
MSTVVLPNGFKVLIAIDGITPLFELVSITPPSLTADDAVEQTNMLTNNYRTFLGGALMTYGDIQLTVNYAVGVYDQMRSFIRRNRVVTIIMPDGTRLIGYCIVQGFEPSELTINERPTATLTLKPSNLTTSNPPSEVAFVLTTGTTTTVAP